MITNKDKMKRKYQCNHCNQPIQDGEVVAVSGEGDVFYHSLSRQLDPEPRSCVVEASFDRLFQGFGFNNRIHYQGKMYVSGDIEKLPNNRDLSFDLNEAGSGDRVLGDISKLAKRGLFAFIFGS